MSLTEGSGKVDVICDSTSHRNPITVATFVGSGVAGSWVLRSPGRSEQRPFAGAQPLADPFGWRSAMPGVDKSAPSASRWRYEIVCPRCRSEAKARPEKLDPMLDRLQENGVSRILLREVTRYLTSS
jgi:hypothetical protein